MTAEKIAKPDNYVNLQGHPQEASLLTDNFNDTGNPADHKIVIAVDGPAASGKGTLATALAAKLGFAYLDTGAVYRTVALLTLKNGGDPSKLDDVRPALDTISRNLDVSQLNDPALRTAEVADAAAVVAQMPEVREVVRKFQNAFAQNPPGGEAGAVLDGRDIGTVVCPNADIKFYVTADAEERARRRFNELKTREPGLTFEDILKEINDRDSHDMHRTISPLKAASDAHVLDTTHLTPPQALDAALDIVNGGKSPAAKIKGMPPTP
jgi:cytidylate kinase